MNRIFNKNIVGIIVLLVIALGIAVTVYLSRQNQDIRQKAAVGDAITFKITPNTLPIGSTEFDANLSLESKGNDVTAVDVAIDSSAVANVTILGFTPTTTYTQVVKTVLSGGRSFHYVGVNPDRTKHITGEGANGTISLGTIRVKVANSGGTLSLGTLIEVTRAGGGGTALGVTNTSPLATYTIAATPTPIALGCNVVGSGPHYTTPSGSARNRIILRATGGTGDTGFIWGNSGPGSLQTIETAGTLRELRVITDTPGTYTVTVRRSSAGHGTGTCTVTVVAAPAATTIPTNTPVPPTVIAYCTQTKGGYLGNCVAGSTITNDLYFWIQEVQKPNPSQNADYNGDGTVNTLDFNLWSKKRYP